MTRGRHFRRFVGARVAPIAAEAERERRFPKEVYGVLRDGGFNFIGDGVRDAVDPRQRSAARGATDT